ncbi:MAG: 30S ribosomal protein S6 [Coprobacillaceae bacterium]
MNKYEIMFIVKPDVEEEARNKVIDGLKDILAADGGVVDNVNEWGLRDLAYEIDDLKKGYYVVVDTTTAPANINEFDRLTKINPAILRILTIRK